MSSSIEIQQVESSYTILTPSSWIAEFENIIESITRSARHSWDKFKTNPKFLRERLDAGEENIAEHCVLNIRFKVSRSIAQQLTRHRIASYCGDSLRARLSKYEWIMPHFNTTEAEILFEEHMFRCVEVYKELLLLGELPEEARDALPLATAQTLDATFNLSSLRNLFRKRALNKKAQAPHRELMEKLLREVASLLPNLFGDLLEQVDTEES